MDNKDSDNVDEGDQPVNSSGITKSPSFYIDLTPIFDEEDDRANVEFIDFISDGNWDATVNGEDEESSSEDTGIYPDKPISPRNCFRCGKPITPRSWHSVHHTNPVFVNDVVTTYYCGMECMWNSNRKKKRSFTGTPRYVGVTSSINT